MNKKEPLSSTRIRMKEKRVAKKATSKFVPPDKRCSKCFYCREITGLDQQTSCCHYALDKGKLREKISKTECGSFLDRESVPKKKISFGDVPMSQWGCGGLGVVCGRDI